MVPCGHGHEDRQTSWNGAPACRGRSQTRNNFAPYVDRRCGIPLRSRTGGDPRRQDDHRRRGLRRQTEIHQEIRASGRYRPRGDDGQGDIVESPEPKVVRQIGTPCSSDPSCGGQCADREEKRVAHGTEIRYQRGRRGMRRSRSSLTLRAPIREVSKPVTSCPSARPPSVESPPVFSGRHSVKPAEEPRHVALIGEARLVRDFL